MKNYIELWNKDTVIELLVILRLARFSAPRFSWSISPATWLNSCVRLKNLMTNSWIWPPRRTIITWLRRAGWRPTVKKFAGTCINEARDLMTVAKADFQNSVSENTCQASPSHPIAAVEVIRFWTAGSDPKQPFATFNRYANQSLCHDQSLLCRYYYSIRHQL